MTAYLIYSDRPKTRHGVMHVRVRQTDELLPLVFSTRERAEEFKHLNYDPSWHYTWTADRHEVLSLVQEPHRVLLDPDPTERDHHPIHVLDALESLA